MIIILVILGFLLLSRGISFQVGANMPTENATGGALSAALGTAPAPPSYFVSGNPGYNAAPKQIQTPVVAVQTPAAVSPGVQTLVNATPSQATTVQRSGPATTPQQAPRIVQPVAIRTRVSSPEVASTFWSRVPYSTIRTVSKA